MTALIAPRHFFMVDIKNILLSWQNRSIYCSIHFIQYSLLIHFVHYIYRSFHLSICEFFVWIIIFLDHLNHFVHGAFWPFRTERLWNILIIWFSSVILNLMNDECFIWIIYTSSIMEHLDHLNHLVYYSFNKGSFDTDHLNHLFIQWTISVLFRLFESVRSWNICFLHSMNHQMLFIWIIKQNTALFH